MAPRNLLKYVRYEAEAPTSGRVLLQVRTPTAGGSHLVATLLTSLDASLRTVRERLVDVAEHGQPSATVLTADAADPLSALTGQSQASARAVLAHALHAVDLRNPFVFVHSGGSRTVPPEAEGQCPLHAFLPLLPAVVNPVTSPMWALCPPPGVVVVRRPVRGGRGLPKSDAPTRLRPALVVLYIRPHARDAVCETVLLERLLMSDVPYGRVVSPQHLGHLLTRWNINTKDHLGRTILHEAAATGNVPVVQYLLQTARGPTALPLALDLVDASGRTALHHAVRGGHAEVVVVLLQCNGQWSPSPGAVPADANMPLPEGSAPAAHQPLRDKLRSVASDLVFNPLQPDYFGVSPLLCATRLRRDDLANALLRALAASPHQVGVDDLRLLHVVGPAVHFGRAFEVPSGLVGPALEAAVTEHEARSPQAPTWRSPWRGDEAYCNVVSLFMSLSPSPMQLAEEGNREALRALLRHPLFDRSTAMRTPSGANLLHCAASANEVEMVKFLCSDAFQALLPENDFLPTHDRPRPQAMTDSSLRTPLHYACMRGHAAVVAVLLDGIRRGTLSNLDPNAVDIGGRSALHWALLRGHVAVAETILSVFAGDVGTPAGLVASLADFSGVTALHAAAAIGATRVVEALVTTYRCHPGTRVAAVSRTLQRRREAPAGRDPLGGRDQVVSVEAGTSGDRPAPRVLVTVTTFGPSPLLLAVQATHRQCAETLIALGAVRSDVPAAVLPEVVDLSVMSQGAQSAARPSGVFMSPDRSARLGQGTVPLPLSRPPPTHTDKTMQCAARFHHYRSIVAAALEGGLMTVAAMVIDAIRAAPNLAARLDEDPTLLVRFAAHDYSLRWLLDRAVGSASHDRADGMTALTACCSAGNLTAAQYLLESVRGVTPSCGRGGIGGASFVRTPLYRAQTFPHRARSAELVELLVRHNAPISRAALGINGDLTCAASLFAPVAQAALRGRHVVLLSLCGAQALAPADFASALWWLLNAVPAVADPVAVASYVTRLLAVAAAGEEEARWASSGGRPASPVVTARDVAEYDAIAVALLRQLAPLTESPIHPADLLHLGAAKCRHFPSFVRAVVAMLEALPRGIVAPIASSATGTVEGRGRSAARDAVPSVQRLLSGMADGSFVPLHRAQQRDVFASICASMPLGEWLQVLSTVACDIGIRPVFTPGRMSCADHAANAGSEAALVFCVACGVLPVHASMRCGVRVRSICGTARAAVGWLKRSMGIDYATGHWAAHTAHKRRRPPVPNRRGHIRRSRAAAPADDDPPPPPPPLDVVQEAALFAFVREAVRSGNAWLVRSVLQQLARLLHLSDFGPRSALVGGVAGGASGPLEGMRSRVLQRWGPLLVNVAVEEAHYDLVRVVVTEFAFSIKAPALPCAVEVTSSRTAAQVAVQLVPNAIALGCPRTTLALLIDEGAPIDVPTALCRRGLQRLRAAMPSSSALSGEFTALFVAAAVAAEEPIRLLHAAACADGVADGFSRRFTLEASRQTLARTIHYDALSAALASRAAADPTALATLLIVQGRWPYANPFVLRMAARRRLWPLAALLLDVYGPRVAVAEALLHCEERKAAAAAIAERRGDPRDDGSDADVNMALLEAAKEAEPAGAPRGHGTDVTSAFGIIAASPHREALALFQRLLSPDFYAKECAGQVRLPQLLCGEGRPEEAIVDLLLRQHQPPLYSLSLRSGNSSLSALLGLAAVAASGGCAAPAWRGVLSPSSRKHATLQVMHRVLTAPRDVLATPATRVGYVLADCAAVDAAEVLQIMLQWVPTILEFLQPTSADSGVGVELSAAHAEGYVRGALFAQALQHEAAACVAVLAVACQDPATRAALARAGSLGFADDRMAGRAIAACLARPPTANATVFERALAGALITDINAVIIDLSALHNASIPSAFGGELRARLGAHARRIAGSAALVLATPLMLAVLAGNAGSVLTMLRAGARPYCSASRAFPTPTGLTAAVAYHRPLATSSDEGTRIAFFTDTEKSSTVPARVLNVAIARAIKAAAAFAAEVPLGTGAGPTLHTAQAAVVVVQLLLRHGALRSLDDAAVISIAVGQIARFLTTNRSSTATSAVAAAALTASEIVESFFAAVDSLASGRTTLPCMDAATATSAASEAGLFLHSLAGLDTHRHMLHVLCASPWCPSGLLELCARRSDRDAADVPDAIGRSPVMLALLHRNAAALRQLLPAASVCHAQRRWSPLMVAAITGHLDVVTVLAGPEALRQTDADGRTALWHACAAGHLACVQRIVSCFESEPDAVGGLLEAFAVEDSAGANPLLQCLLRGHDAVGMALMESLPAKVVLAASASAGWPSGRGYSLLHAAATGGCERVIHYVIDLAAKAPREYGLLRERLMATPDAPPDAEALWPFLLRDANGESPLSLASQLGHTRVAGQIIRALRKAFADRPAPDGAIGALEGQLLGGTPHGRRLPFGWLPAALALGTRLQASAATAHQTLRPAVTQWLRGCTTAMLHYCVRTNNLVLMRVLGDLGHADAPDRTERRETALHIAASRHQTDAVQLLLRLGMSDPFATDATGRTALDRCVLAGGRASARAEQCGAFLFSVMARSRRFLTHTFPAGPSLAEALPALLCESRLRELFHFVVGHLVAAGGGGAAGARAVYASLSTSLPHGTLWTPPALDDTADGVDGDTDSEGSCFSALEVAALTGCPSMVLAVIAVLRRLQSQMAEGGSVSVRSSFLARYGQNLSPPVRVILYDLFKLRAAAFCGPRAHARLHFADVRVLGIAALEADAALRAASGYFLTPAREREVLPELLQLLQAAMGTGAPTVAVDEDAVAELAPAEATTYLRRVTGVVLAGRFVGLPRSDYRSVRLITCSPATDGIAAPGLRADASEGPSHLIDVTTVQSGSLACGPARPSGAGGEIEAAVGSPLAAARKDIDRAAQQLTAVLQQGPSPAADPVPAPWSRYAPLRSLTVKVEWAAEHHPAALRQAIGVCFSKATDTPLADELLRAAQLLQDEVFRYRWGVQGGPSFLLRDIVAACRDAGLDEPGPPCSGSGAFPREIRLQFVPLSSVRSTDGIAGQSLPLRPADVLGQHDDEGPVIVPFCALGIGKPLRTPDLAQHALAPVLRDPLSTYLAPVWAAIEADGIRAAAQTLKQRFIVAPLLARFPSSPNVAAFVEGLKFKVELESSSLLQGGYAAVATTAVQRLGEALGDLAAMSQGNGAVSARVAGGFLQEVRHVSVVITALAGSSVRRVPAGSSGMSTRGAEAGLANKLVAVVGVAERLHVSELFAAMWAQSLSIELERVRPAVTAAITESQDRLATYFPTVPLVVEGCAAIAHGASVSPVECPAAFADEAEAALFRALALLPQSPGGPCPVLEPIVSGLLVGWDTLLGAHLRRVIKAVHVCCPSALQVCPRPVLHVSDAGILRFEAPLLALPVRSCNRLGALPAITAECVAGLALQQAALIAPEVIDDVDAGRAFGPWSTLRVGGPCGRHVRPGGAFWVRVEERNILGMSLGRDLFNLNAEHRERSVAKEADDLDAPPHGAARPANPYRALQEFRLAVHERVRAVSSDPGAFKVHIHSLAPQRLVRVEVPGTVRRVPSDIHSDSSAGVWSNLVFKATAPKVGALHGTEAAVTATLLRGPVDFGASPLLSVAAFPVTDIDLVPAAARARIVGLRGMRHQRTTTGPQSAVLLRGGRAFSVTVSLSGEGGRPWSAYQYAACWRGGRALTIDTEPAAAGSLSVSGAVLGEAGLVVTLQVAAADGAVPVVLEGPALCINAPGSTAALRVEICAKALVLGPAQWSTAEAARRGLTAVSAADAAPANAAAQRRIDKRRSERVALYFRRKVRLTQAEARRRELAEAQLLRCVVPGSMLEGRRK